MLAPPSLRPVSAISVPDLSSKIKRPAQLPRRSTLKRSIDETNLMEVPSSPSKRSRVTFDSDVEIVSADDEEDLDPLVVKEQVRRAIQRHFVGEDERFEHIKSLFSASPERESAPSTKVLRLHLQALLANVSSLNSSCNSLVYAVVNSEWIGRDEGYYAMFVRFLGTLVAAQAGYLGMVMNMLVNLLGKQKTRRVRDARAVRQPNIHRRIFRAIQHINGRVPAATATLAGCVSNKLSFDFQQAEERMIFVRNFMQMINYVPELQAQILDNVMRELIKLDVSVQAELDEEEEDAEDDIMQHMSSSQTLLPTSQTMKDLSDEDDLSTTDESDLEEEDEDHVDEVTARRRKLKEDIRQVDLIMDIMFDYYAKLTAPTSSSRIRDNAIEQLISQFRYQIVPTYRSRHPQFLIFHFAQQSPINVDQFVATCIELLMDQRQPQINRHAAAAYFSGFVGRGQHVSPSVVQNCINLLCVQLDKLRKLYDRPEKHPSPDLRRFGDFYSVFQSILYIFCFRYKDIGATSSDFDEDDEDSDMEEESVERYQFPEKLMDTLREAIESKLNPLRVCTLGIVEQFADLSQALDMFYLHSRLEQNKRIRVGAQWRGLSDLNINQPVRDVGWVGDNGRIEGYFPFDPYVLPISKHWIEGYYVQWQGLPGEQDDDSDSDDGGVVVEDDDDEEDTMMHSGTLSVDDYGEE